MQLAAPSRTKIKRYHDLSDEIERLIEKKNSKYTNGAWRPIIYLKEYFTSNDIRSYYRLSDICVVSSLHDDMNLVAKEYVAEKNDLTGVLLLSKFAGASRELNEALQINPYSIEEFADNIQLACVMPIDEKMKRMQNMQKIVEQNNVYSWAASIITSLTNLQKT